ncbi:MAG: GtrA family protein [Desulfovibrio sp.]|jgi:putative flippase GtrA|nr:GtrA family protein [Desulfovibrio sp.]
MTTRASLVSGLFVRRWIRFGLMGGISTLSYFLFGHLLVTVLELPLFVGNTAAYLLAFCVSYMGQCRWTFQARGVHRSMLPRYALTQGIGLGFNTFLIWLMRHMGLSYTFSMPVAALLVAVSTYLLCKYFVFPNGQGVD